MKTERAPVKGPGAGVPAALMLLRLWRRPEDCAFQLKSEPAALSEQLPEAA